MFILDLSVPFHSHPIPTLQARRFHHTRNVQLMGSEMFFHEPPSTKVKQMALNIPAQTQIEDSNIIIACFAQSIPIPFLIPKHQV